MVEQHKSKSGTGKGTGKSWWQVWTGQKTTSGTDMQIEALLFKQMKLEVILPAHYYCYYRLKLRVSKLLLKSGLTLKVIYFNFVL
jgi:hypothetical protein